MVPSDLFFAEAQEVRGVIVEDVALLTAGKERRFLDHFDRRLDDAGPDHLVRAEHDPVSIPRVHNLLEEPVKCRLAKSDPESGGVQYSLSCSDIDRIEENRVILDCDAAEAKKRWRDENRSRALFEREDQGEMGPRILDRSFEGTYR